MSDHTCRICGKPLERCECVDYNPSRLSWDALLLRCRCTRSALRETEARLAAVTAALREAKLNKHDAYCPAGFTGEHREMYVHLAAKHDYVGGALACTCGLTSHNAAIDAALAMGEEASGAD